ncbi:alpha/beta hydrolase fold domain-containing protein [Macroventuria anomochaeta]|uniref:Alpha/beta hydrolase fold domain-containing protein n=1 Tax=Macroventuria anomochaeta TaxID=301207 RepID=A0ACB6SJ90_9PLEO|nr:alpha/beta hydrolase fold domain-containing protein [Macroventuria anomochaeta]KAF2633687.1 alpha/beta hydrolase fold domain-containing protein [Macroventuria anomochaeta]
MITSTVLEDENIQLEDGRKLSYATYGSPVPRTTVIYMHGFPSSRYEGKLWHSACAKRMIRLIAPDRPGIGLSTYQSNRRILDWPADILALADHLKISQFYILGVSGGAPYALACIKRIPKERLLGVSVVSGMYPTKFGTAGMMLQSRMLYWIAPWMTGLISFIFDTSMGKAARCSDPQVFEDMLEQEVENWHAGDKAAMKDPKHWPTFVAMMREAFVHGSRGASWEARLEGSEWEFELSQLCIGSNIGCPLTLWHGTEDVNCPAAMVKKAKALMPGSNSHMMEGEGHVSFIFNKADEILEDLIGVEEEEDFIHIE